MAMSATCSEIIWLRSLLIDLGFSQASSTLLHVENTSAIQIAGNPVYYERTKHIEVDYHFIRESFDRRVITLPHIFTKSMTHQRHHFLVRKLIFVDLPISI